ncbi:hypothetical protein VL10_23980 [Leclercia adecarboxylata]|nr:hypothetical protein VL10_23980 [Leclercia adecarboxylata]KMN66740.1 hypothetical protein VK95_04420 [Leclercia sp. LK8]
MLLTLYALAGLCIGSFMNVVVYRLPAMVLREQQPDRFSGFPAKLSLAFPRSYCPLCHQTLGALQLLPLIGWVWQRGHCKYCGGVIPLRYPLMELLHAVLFVLIAWRTPSPEMALIFCLFSSLLIALATIDYCYMLLPDALTLPLLWGGLLLNATSFGLVSLHSSLYGAVGGYLSLWIIQQLYRFFRHKEGMGGGDLKLLAALGAWLGVESINMIALTASLLMLALCILRGGESKDRYLPFGPALIAGAGIWLLCQMQVLTPSITRLIHSLTFPSF